MPWCQWGTTSNKSMLQNVSSSLWVEMQISPATYILYAMNCEKKKRHFWAFVTIFFFKN